MPNSPIKVSSPGRLFAGRPVDAKGPAALLLVEYLMHHLVDKAVLTREDFVEIIEGAAEVECGEGIASACQPLTFQGSLLYPLGAAFRKELGS